MLILSRRTAECICLGDEIVLTIVSVGNDKVRIGVQAPPNVRILRNELEVDIISLPRSGKAQETGALSPAESEERTNRRAA